MERLRDRRSRSESAGSHHPGKAKLRMTALLMITSDTDTAANMMNIGELSPGRANTLFPMTQNSVFIYVTSKLKGLLHSATRSVPERRPCCVCAESGVPPRRQRVLKRSHITPFSTSTNAGKREPVAFIVSPTRD